MPEATTLLTDKQNASRVRKRDHMVTKITIEIGTPISEMSPRGVGAAAETHYQLRETATLAVSKIPGLIGTPKIEEAKTGKR